MRATLNIVKSTWGSKFLTVDMTQKSFIFIFPAKASKANFNSENREELEELHKTIK
jgi:hypothetical protein